MAIGLLDFFATSTNRQQTAEIAEIAMRDFQLALGERHFFDRSEGFYVRVSYVGDHGDIGISDEHRLERSGTTCDLAGSGVACHGTNEVGQLGTGDGPDRSEPRIVDLPGKAIALAGGDRSWCAVLETGTLTCWGANDGGQGYHPETQGASAQGQHHVRVAA